MALFTKNMRKHIFVHPAQQNRLHGAVKSALLKDKKKYSDRLEGALLDVSTLRVVGNRYVIVDGYLSMEVEANFQVFCPTVGMLLEGVVNKISRGHIGCLVMELFNASLTLSPNSSVTLNVGDTCEFSVTDVIIDGDILSLRGSLSSDFSEATSDGEDKEESEKEKKKNDGTVKANNKNISNDDLFAKGVLTQSDPTSPSKKSPTKEMKKEPVYELEETPTTDLTSPSKKSSKKKKKEPVYELEETPMTDLTSPSKKSPTEKIKKEPVYELEESPTTEQTSPSKKSPKKIKKEPVYQLEETPTTSGHDEAVLKRHSKSHKKSKGIAEENADESILTPHREEIQSPSKCKKKSRKSSELIDAVDIKKEALTPLKSDRHSSSDSSSPSKKAKKSSKIQL